MKEEIRISVTRSRRVVGKFLVSELKSRRFQIGVCQRSFAVELSLANTHELMIYIRSGCIDLGP